MEKDLDCKVLSTERILRDCDILFVGMGGAGLSSVGRSTIGELSEGVRSAFRLNSFGMVDELC